MCVCVCWVCVCVCVCVCVKNHHVHFQGKLGFVSLTPNVVQFSSTDVYKSKCILLTHPTIQVKTVVFDKTGTLTHGRPTVTKALLFVSEAICPHQLFIAIVGLAESNSEHPLGVAVLNFAKKV